MPLHPNTRRQLAEHAIRRGLKLIDDAWRTDPQFTRELLRSFIMANFTDLESAWNFLEPLIPDLATRTTMANIITIANTLSAAGVTPNGLPAPQASAPTTTTTDATSAAPTTA